MSDHPIDISNPGADAAVLTAALADLLDDEFADASHAGATDNPHSVSKAQVGLGNVDNTSDANKPVSTATQEALDDKADDNHTHTLADVTDSGDAAAAGVKHSVEIDDDAIQLVGDAATPGNNKVYGTDGTGVKGWKNDPAGEGSGDVTGPEGGVTDGHAVVFDGTTGKEIKTAGFVPANASHSHTLSDISDAGDAAGLDVGTTAGTVAAGDDSRFGGGDMLASEYDPQDIGADAFDRLNHHGATWRFPVTPYDFAEGVGIGNSVNDTDAMLAFATHITENDVGKARIAGNFLLEEGVVIGPSVDEGQVATKLIECNAILTAVAPIENLVTFKRFIGSYMVGGLRAHGTGGSSLSSNTAINGIVLDRVSRSTFGFLEGWRFRGWGIRNVSANDHFIEISKVRSLDCGGGARGTRLFSVNVTDFDKTGSANIHQRSVLTVDDPNNLPAAAHELNWGFVVVNGFPHKITNVDYDLGTLTVFPWLATADEVAGDFDLVFGGGLRLGGQSAKSVVGSIDTTRSGTGLWVHGIGTPEVIGHGSQFDGVSIALGHGPANVFGGLALMGGYWEAHEVANIVHVSQTSSASSGSTITGITALSLPAVFSPRHRATGGVITASRYFPVDLTINNRRWNVESEDDVWAASDARANYTLNNIPLPYPVHLRPSAATFTINLEDEFHYRRLKGSVPVDVILSGMGDRKGADGGYTGAIVINAGQGKTINDTGFEAISFTGPAMPLRITAWPEHDGSGPNIWRVTREEMPIVTGTDVSPTYPGDITDLDVVGAGADFLTVEFTEADDADYYEYRISLEGSGAWGGAEELPGSADGGTFTGDVTGLDVNESYDVQVRGQNTNGPGPWSNTATGLTAEPPAWQKLIDYATATGATAVYDPTNPNTRTPVADKIPALSDGLGNLPDAVQATAANQPPLVAGAFGEFDALQGERRSTTDGNKIETTDAVSESLPIFMACVANFSTNSGRQNVCAFRATNARSAFLRDSGAYQMTGGSADLISFGAGDSSPHVFGVLWTAVSANFKLWVDSVERSQVGGSTDNPLGLNKVALLGQHNGTNDVLDGRLGPVVIYTGEEPSTEVRNGLFALLHEISGIPEAE